MFMREDKDILLFGEFEEMYWWFLVWGFFRDRIDFILWNYWFFVVVSIIRKGLCGICCYLLCGEVFDIIFSILWDESEYSWLCWERKCWIGRYYGFKFRRFVCKILLRSKYEICCGLINVVKF